MGHEGAIVAHVRIGRAEARKGSLVEFFAASPLRDAGMDLDRPRDFGPEINP